MAQRDPEVQDSNLGLPRLPLEGESLSPQAYRADYKIDPDTGCWIWQKMISVAGYGTGSFKRVPGVDTRWAHRAYYIVANGPIPPYPESVIDHLCRNRACVNPKHLEAVIPQQNIHRGNATKLTMEIAREVRRRVQAGESSGQIRRDLGVSIQNVWWIAEDKAWREDPSAPRQPVWPIKDCAYCGERIPPERGRKAKYCSHEHKVKGRR